MRTLNHIFSAIGLISFLSLGACQTLPTHQGPHFGPADDAVQHQEQNSAFEHGKYVPAQDFLTPDLMRSSLHQVNTQAYNDGYANNYEITTPHHVYVVQGTRQAIDLIYEIDATERLRQTPTLAAAGKSFKDRTTNLVQTPYRAIAGGKARYADAQAAQDKSGVGRSLKSVSSGFGSVFAQLGNGMRELGTTGVRIVSSASGTKCSGFNCISKAGGDVWSGFNSLVGKHAAAKRMHQRIGTDPYSDNQVLQREVSRLAYAESYTGTGYKFGIGAAGIPVVSILAKGVGYYNNTEFVAQYEDAHKRRKAERKLLKNWGVDKEAITSLYRNPVFTHTTRTRLVMTLAKIGSQDMRVKLAEQASISTTRYIGESKLAVYEYLAKLDQGGTISGFVQNAPMAIAVRNNDTLILPFAVDYLQWTQEVAGPIQSFANLVGNPTPYRHAEIHIRGTASSLFKDNARKLGLSVVEISDN